MKSLDYLAFKAIILVILKALSHNIQHALPTRYKEKEGIQELYS